MRLLSRIFGDSKSADSIIDGAKRGIDALVFTQEEKATMSQKAFELYIKFMEATSGQNLARRYIAMIVVALWASLTVTLVVLAILASIFGWESGPHEAIIEILMEMRVTEITLLITGFYFTKHLLTSAFQARAGK